MKTLLLTLLTIIIFGAQANAPQDSITFYGKVLKVDGHNVMHVVRGDRILFVSLAFLNTPIRGEPYFEETNNFLKETLDQEWLMFTIVRYGRNANVKPALVRLKDQTSLNAEVIRKGMGMVDLATKPPPALIDQAITASKAKVGMWGLEKTLDPLDREIMVASGDEIQSFLSKENKTGIKPYVLLKEKKLAMPIFCAMILKYDDIALTAHSARNKGYVVIEDCGDPNFHIQKK